MADPVPSKKIIFNSCSLVSNSENRIIKLRVVGNDNLELFFKLIKKDVNLYIKTEERPLEKKKLYNIPGYDEKYYPNYELVNDNWYIIDLEFCSTKDKEIFNKNISIKYPDCIIHM